MGFEVSCRTLVRGKGTLDLATLGIFKAIEGELGTLELVLTLVVDKLVPIVVGVVVVA